MINKIVEIQVSELTELAIKNYICGNITSLSELARHLSKNEDRQYTRQSAVNLVATVIPYWYKIGKIEINNGGVESENTN